MGFEVAHRVEHCPAASLRKVNKTREARKQAKHRTKKGFTMSTPALCTAHHTSSKLYLSGADVLLATSLHSGYTMRTEIGPMVLQPHS